MNIELGQYKNSHSSGNKIVRLLWICVWACFAKCTPRWCLNRWRCFLLRLFGARVGKMCRINGGAEIWFPKNLVVGDNCWIDNNTKIYNVERITLGDNCVVSSGSFLCTASHDVSSPNFELTTSPISIANCVWVASNAIVLPGVSVGEGAVIGAGAVVTRDVAPWTIVGGNPAREISKRKVRG